MMLASELRANARQTLEGRWGKAALITLVFAIITFLLNFLNVIPVIGSLALLVISTPIAYGIVAAFIKFTRNEDFTYTTFLSEGLSNIVKVWSTILWVALKLLPWIILLIVAIILLGMSGASVAVTSSVSSSLFLSLLSLAVYIFAIIMLIIKSFSYVIVYFVLYDNPTLSGKEIVEKCATLMQNNKWRFFCLTFSFIGWAFLSAFTFGIGMLWLAPYVQIAAIHFYEELANQNKEPKVEETKTDEQNPVQEN